jgi:hypothetical protein
MSTFEKLSCFLQKITIILVYLYRRIYDGRKRWISQDRGRIFEYASSKIANIQCNDFKQIFWKYTILWLQNESLGTRLRVLFHISRYLGRLIVETRLSF